MLGAGRRVYSPRRQYTASAPPESTLWATAAGGRKYIGYKTVHCLAGVWGAFTLQPGQEGRRQRNNISGLLGMEYLTNRMFKTNEDV